MATKQDKSTTDKPFAVIATGGKQYKVSAGDTIKIEKLEGEFKEGDKITFDKVLLVGEGENVSFGAPHVGGAKVAASFVNAGRNKTIDVIKYKQKSRYFKKYGHRQPYHMVKIESVK